MNCPYCGNDKTKVVATVNTPGRVTRRRECLKCRERFSTVEFLAPVVFPVTPDDIKSLNDLTHDLFSASSAIIGFLRRWNL
jgi:transcriptional regulator NrdR family protein